MRLSHARRAMSVRFDDPNLVSCAGLAAAMATSARCGLAALLTDRLQIGAKGRANATAKIFALVAGMVAGADSISDMGLLRHGGMNRLFTDVRASSTLRTFLRVFTFGHVSQLDAVAAGCWAGWPWRPRSWPAPTRWRSSTWTTSCAIPTAMPSRAPGAATPASTGSTPCSPRSPRRAAPVVAATRLRKGSRNSVRGAAKLVSDTLATARRAGVTGLVIVRADSAYYGYDIIAGRAGRVPGSPSPPATLPP